MFYLFRENTLKFEHSPNYSFIFPFEENFDIDGHRQWMENNWHVSLYLGATYLAVIFGGQLLMEKRSRFDLQPLLVLWNAALAAFSIMGTVRVFPELYFVLKEYGLDFSVCYSAHSSQHKIVAFWCYMWVLSKVPELLDTVFIVLRKRKLIFLHWYHHVLTMLFAFYVYSEHPALGRWFVFLNYLVHGFMYSYYTFRALNVRINSKISMSLTAIQILQMIVAAFVCGYTHMLVKSGRSNCQTSQLVTSFVGYMALSYMVLFANFFFQTYLSKPKKKNE